MKYFTLLILCLVGFNQMACTHLAVTQPVGPGGAIVAADANGITFNDQGKALWVGEGVPAAWFVSTSQGWHLTTLQWHEGNAIRLQRANP